MQKVFNMGCGFVAIVPAGRRRGCERAAERPSSGHRADRTVTADAGRVALPALGLAGDASGLARA